MAKIAIDMEKPAQWVTKMCRLYFADIYARKTEGIPKAYPAPGVESTLQEVQQFLPDLEAKMIEFLAEWVVTLLSPAQIVKARAFHLTFMFVKEYWFLEFYLGLKVTASLGQEESYRRPCGEVGRAVSFDIADRLPVVVRFPAGPQVSLKVGDQPKGRWRRPQKKVKKSLTPESSTVK